MVWKAALFAAMALGCANGANGLHAAAPAAAYDPDSSELDAYIEEALMARLPPVDPDRLLLRELQGERARKASHR